jgi:Carboxypeptidase regulatory-like domain
MDAWQNQLVVIACLSLGVGQALAAEPAAKTSSGVADVSLNAQAELIGRAIDSHGAPIDGAMVELSQKGSMLEKTTTDHTGLYRFTSVRQGTYQITMGRQAQSIRVWEPRLAPPSSQQLVNTVRDSGIIRGQNDRAGNTIGVLGGITGVALGVYAIDIAMDAEDEANENRRRLNSLVSP